MVWQLLRAPAACPGELLQHSSHLSFDSRYAISETPTETYQDDRGTIPIKAHSDSQQMTMSTAWHPPLHVCVYVCRYVYTYAYTYTYIDLRMLLVSFTLQLPEIGVS